MNTAGTTGSLLEGTTITSNATGVAIRPYQRPFDDASIVVSASILLTLMVLGIVGNLMTILVIVKSKKLRGVFNMFILSLCVSDLTSAIISPLFLYRRTWGYDVWRIPSVFCKIYWGADMWTSFVTALHILIFAILRLISVRWPHTYNKIKIKHARACIVVVWAVAFLSGFIPFVVWFDAGIRPRNTDLPDAKWPACTLEPEWTAVYSTYQRITFPLFFYVPTVLIIVLTLSIGIILNLRKRERDAKFAAKLNVDAAKKLRKGAQKEKEAMIQLTLIAGSFMLGYVPFTAYEISSMATPTITPADERFWWRFGMAEYICLRFSETLNPVFYNFSSPKLRRETIRTFWPLFATFCRCCMKGIESAPPPSSNTSANTEGLPGIKTIVTSNGSPTKSQDNIVMSPSRKVE